MANVVSGGNNNLNINSNIGGPSGNYGSTIKQNSSSINLKTEFSIGTNEKNTEEYNFSGAIYELESERNNRLSENYDGFDSFNKIMNGVDSFENIMKNLNNISSASVKEKDINISDYSDELNNWINIFDSTKKQLEEEKSTLTNKYYDFIKDDVTCKYPDLWTVGYICYVPNFFKSNHNVLNNYLMHYGVNFTDADYDDWVQKFYDYADNEYTEGFNKYFIEHMGMTY